MAKNSAQAGPGALTVGYIFLIILGLLFLWLSLGEIKDIIKAGMGKISYDGPTLAMIFISLGMLCIFHAALKISEIRIEDANKQLFPDQPWYHKGQFDGFSAKISSLTSITYAFIISTGLVAFSYRVWQARDDFWPDSFSNIFSEDGLMTGGALFLFLFTFMGVLYGVVSLFNLLKYGPAHIELSQMPLTPGCKFTVSADVSSKIPRSSKAVFQLLCFHRFNRKAGNKTESEIETEVERKIETEVSLKKAKQFNNRLYFETEMQIPEDAPPTDKRNSDDTYEWELNLNIDFGYEMSVFAPVYLPRRQSDLKLNPKMKKKTESAENLKNIDDK